MKKKAIKVGDKVQTTHLARTLVGTVESIDSNGVAIIVDSIWKEDGSEQPRARSLVANLIIAK